MPFVKWCLDVNRASLLRVGVGEKDYPKDVPVSRFQFLLRNSSSILPPLVLQIHVFPINAGSQAKESLIVQINRYRLKSCDLVFETFPIVLFVYSLVSQYRTIDFNDIYSTVKIDIINDKQSF